jgi:zinc transport system substrate-binding protein
MLHSFKTFNTSRFLIRAYTLLLILPVAAFLSTSVIAADTSADASNQPDKSGPVVVTIKPLYSLVAHLTEGIETPVLLMKQMQSPHHYSMRPSERRLLADAGIIVWLGPQLESYLSKIIEQKDPASVITAIQADNLRLLHKRKKHSHHDEQPQETPDSDDGNTDPDQTDPHIWLSTHNALMISRQISERLIARDPENSERYKANLERLSDSIKQTGSDIKMTLQDHAQPFISFHDAFQYFEYENQLHYIDSINFDDESTSSLKHLRQVRTSIDRYHIQCLVYQEPKPAIIDSLQRQTSIRTVALDPLGRQLDDDKQAWFELMRNLAQNFHICLTPAGDHH